MKARFTLLAALLLCAVLAFGQAETGLISGTVVDPTGAVIPNAQVTVTGVNTGVTRTTTSTSTGLYTVSNLQPGLYEVVVKAPGFGEFRQRITVTVGSRNAIDAKLAPAGSSTTVEVVASGAAQVNTESPSLSQVVTSTDIVTLPTITRNPYDLVATAGNVSSDPNGATGRGTGVAINGQRAASTDILLDGGENVDTFTATVGQAVPLDSVQEFRVSSNNFSAEYGRASGGIVNVATKAGTNDFHGTAYEFYRGAALSANSQENIQSELPKDNFVRNQFGYSVGGPILKNKLFFFSSTEWIRVRSQQLRQYWVPSTAFVGAAAPTTQQFFQAYGQIVPTGTQGQVLTKADLVTPVAQGGLGIVGAGAPGSAWGALPLTTPVFNLITNPVNVDVGGGDPQNQVQTVGRVDLNVSPATQFYTRYALQDSNLFSGTVSDSPYAGFNTGEKIRNQNLLLNLTHTFGNAFVSQSKAIYNRLFDLQPLNGAPTPTLFFKGVRTVISGRRAYLPGYLPGDPGSGIPFGGPQNLYQFYQDFGWTRNNHSFRFGGNYIHMRDNRVFGAYETAVEQLGGNDLSTGLNNFLLGQLTSYRTAVNPQGAFPCQFDYAAGTAIVTPACSVSLPATQPQFGRNNRYNDFAIYGQDTWKTFPRLTLTLGLRYEYYGVQHNVNPRLDANFYLGQGANFWEQYRNGGAQIAPDSPVGGLWKPDRNNFAPRVGFAWDLFGNGTTSLRGGYGIAYERNFGNVTFNVIQNPPNYATISLTPQDVGGNLPIATENLGPFATGVGSKPLLSPSVRHVSQDIRTAYSEMWNLSLERQLIPNTVLSFEYSGSRGLKLYSLEDLNRLGSGVIYLGDPVDTGYRLNQNYGIGSFNRANRGFSYYNGLNIRLQTTKVGKTGLQFTTNYTWSHAIDNLSSTFSDSFANYNTGLLDPFNPALDKGNADFDVRHRFVFSGIWTMPWLNNGTGWKRQVFGGWQLAPIFSIQSGNPFTLYDCLNSVFYCARARALGPAQYVAGGAAGATMDANLYEYLNLNNDPGYANPLTGTSEFGECTVPGEGAQHPCPWPTNMTPRNAFRGPANWGTTLGIYKNFAATERVSLQLRGEFFNLFNHQNNFLETGSLDASGCVGDVLGPCTFTVPVKAGIRPDGTLDKRDIQLAFKIIF